jgi:hypothetical protein
MTGNDVTDPDNAPCDIEGTGRNAVGDTAVTGTIN